MRSGKWLLIVMAVLGLSVFPMTAGADPVQGVLVADSDNGYAFVGWYGAYEFPTTEGQTWTILLDVIKVGTSNADPTLTDILLFTADGSNDPDNPGNLDAGTIYNRLIAEGYKVTTADQADILTMNDYSLYDLVFYPNLDDHSALNVVHAGIPFITMEPGQTGEMNIGTGVSTFNGWAQIFHDDMTDDTLVFDNAVRTEAITAAGNGVVYVSLSVPEPGTLTLLASGLSGLAWLRRRRVADRV